MKNIRYALKNLFKKENNSLIKVLSLGMGLASGMVMIAKVSFDTSFDTSYPDSGNIYIIRQNFQMGEQTPINTFTVSGGVAGALNDYIPGVVLTTRTTDIGSGKFSDREGNTYSGNTLAVDTNFLKMFPTGILSGNQAILAEPFRVFISESAAEKLGGIEKAMGQTLYDAEYPNMEFTVSGVFEDYPVNSTVGRDLLLSMATIDRRSSENLSMGNDRYYGYVKLADNIDPYGREVTDGIRRMQVEKMNIEALEQMGRKMTYSLFPLENYYGTQGMTRVMGIVLAALATLLLLTSSLNYVLIMISSYIGKTREIGIRKCYGAGGWNIRSLILSETFLHIVLAAALAIAVLYASRGEVESLLGTSYKAMFTFRSISILAGVCAAVFLVSGLLPACIFARIPASTIFTRFKNDRRIWKHALLGSQFLIVTVFISFMAIAFSQYSKMVNFDPGYNCDGIVYADVRGVDAEKVRTTIEELKRVPGIECVETGTLPFLMGPSGNNVSLPEAPQDYLFNFGDLYYYSPGYYEMMGIDIIEGKAPVNPGEAAVSRRFVEELGKHTEPGDGVVGKTLFMTEHGLVTITGVYEDFFLGNAFEQDDRPSVMHAPYYEDFYTMVVMKLSGQSPEDFIKIQKVFSDITGRDDLLILSYDELVRTAYRPGKTVRDMIAIVGTVALLITVIGIIAYTSEDTRRRSKEIAIRKVNGAVSAEIIGLLVKDISALAITCIAAGCIIAVYPSRMLLGYFVTRIDLSPAYFICSGLAIYMAVIAVTVLKCRKIASENPVVSLRNE